MRRTLPRYNTSTLIAGTGWRSGSIRTGRNRIPNSALFRRDIADPRRMHGDVLETIGEMYPLVGCWPLLQSQAGSPFPCRADRPRCEAATAVGANIIQLVLDAPRAKRALIR